MAKTLSVQGGFLKYEDDSIPIIKVYNLIELTVKVNGDNIDFPDGNSVAYNDAALTNSFASVEAFLDQIGTWKDTAAASFNTESTLNQSTTLLTNGSTFTGTAEQNSYNDVMVVVKTDQDGILYVEFSPDGTNWDTSLSFQYKTDRINPPHIFEKGGRYFRARFTNDSGSDQTYFRLNTYFGNTMSALTAPINGTLAENYDATVVRPTDYESEVAMGKRQGRTTWNKFGFNTDSDVGTEIIASFGGAFDPTTDIMSTAQTFTIAYNNTTDGLGQTGALTLGITYLDENYLSQFAIHTLSNTGSDVTSFTGLGINRVYVLSNGGAGYNVNDITITATTDATTQAQIPAEDSLTQQCIFHTQINHTFLTDYLRFKILKPSGGGSGNGFIKGYTWSRVTNTRYEIYKEAYATSSSQDIVIELRPSQKFPIGGREVLYFVIENTSGNNTYISGRFSGIEERVL